LGEIASLKPVSSAKAEVVAKPGTGASPQQPSEWVDLLEWADGIDWAPRGINWNVNIEGPASKEGVTLKMRRAGRFPLPAIIDGDYEMEIDFTRMEGQESVSIFFPVGTHNMHFECGAARNTLSCVHWIDGIDGVSLPGNGTARRSAPLANGIRHRFVVRVKRAADQAEFHIDLDNEKDHVQWKGRYSSLTNMDEGDWRLTLVQHPWLGGWDDVIQYHKVRVRMLSGTIKRDVITDTDRDADLKAGFVRLVGQPAISPRVTYADFLINQVCWQVGGGEAERLWPLVTRTPAACREYYGAHAPSRFKCPIPPAARSFSAIGYNHASRTTIYKVLIDGNKVYDSGVAGIDVIKVDIPPNASLLELVIDEAGGDNFDHNYWCYPRFHTVHVDKITDAMLNGKPSPLKFVIAAQEVGKGGEFTQHQAMGGVALAAPLDFRDAVPCDEFLFAVANSSVTYIVPSGMTRFSAIGYNTRSNHVQFEVWADARKLYESPRAGIAPIQVKLPAGTKTIELKANDMGDGRYDYSMWCYPRLYKK
ncbi:MAG: hypothetical protein JWN70_7237, partial [Planctomycetaceae bacterium]|nr:hypothetical protein [Planctomycetaceae bacterium]